VETSHIKTELKYCDIRLYILGRGFGEGGVRKSFKMMCTGGFWYQRRWILVSSTCCRIF